MNGWPVMPGRLGVGPSTVASKVSHVDDDAFHVKT